MKYKISYCDMKIYSAFTFQDQTKKEIAEDYGISCTRVTQIIHKVAFLLSLDCYIEVEDSSDHDFKLRLSDTYGKNTHD